MELTSSWMERVAKANQVSLMQLLAALVDRYPELRCSGEVCLNCGLPPAWSRALAEWCRLDESQIQALDLKQRYPGRGLSWFSHRRALPNNSGLAAGSPWLASPKFCARCVQQQARAGQPIHRRTEWAPAFMTHCPEHFGEPLWQHCLCCRREDSGWIIVARRRHGDEVRCRYCTVAFHHWSQPDAQPLTASLQVTLRLESTLLGCFRGQSPDPFWVGPVDAETFVCLTAELLRLLTQRDRQGVWILADHLAGKDWWDNHVLGYDAVTTLERQEHLSSRLKLVASLAKCLLGPRVLEFFRLHSAAYVGKKGPYPFAVLFRELPAEQKDKLIEGAQRWPNKLRRQPEWYRNDLQAGPLDSKVGGQESTNGLRFGFKKQVQSTI